MMTPGNDEWKSFPACLQKGRTAFANVFLKVIGTLSAEPWVSPRTDSHTAVTVSLCNNSLKEQFLFIVFFLFRNIPQPEWLTRTKFHSRHWG